MDKRMDYRHITADMNLDVKIVIEGTKVLHGKVIDISRGGIRFESLSAELSEVTFETVEIVFSYCDISYALEIELLRSTTDKNTHVYAGRFKGVGSLIAINLLELQASESLELAYV